MNSLKMMARMATRTARMIAFTMMSDGAFAAASRAVIEEGAITVG